MPGNPDLTSIRYNKGGGKTAKLPSSIVWPRITTGRWLLQQRKQYRKVKAWFDSYHGDLLRRFSRSNVTGAEVRDLAQEVYLRLLRVSDPDLIRYPRAYIMRMASNVIEEWSFRDGRFAIADQADPETMPASDNPEVESDRTERSKRITDALNRLPPMYRSAVALKAQHGLTVAEIAVRLGVTERMVRRYLEKGYARLRHNLADERTHLR